VVTPQTLDSNLQQILYLALIDPAGRVLVSSRGFTPQARSELLQPATHAVLGSNYPARPVGYKFVKPSQVAALSRGSGDLSGHFYDQVAIPNSTWTVVLSDPDGPLFASVSGLRKWVPWLILIAFALVVGAAWALGRRVLQSAERNVVDAYKASEMKSGLVANMSHEIRTLPDQTRASAGQRGRWSQRPREARLRRV
jgi:hypothetical protein